MKLILTTLLQSLVFWALSPSGNGIVFTPSEGALPYEDHIEMSGEQMAFVLRWGVHEDGSFHSERSLVFPMLRTIPNNTHASLMQRMGVDIPSHISVNGLSMTSEKARTAWKTLFDDIYVQCSVLGRSPVMNLRPSFGRSTSFHSSVRFGHENDVLRKVIEDLLESGGSGPAYEFDLVNLTRQWLSNCFEQKFALYKEAYTNGDTEALAGLKNELLGIFDTLDNLLASQPYFLVGKWIKDARSWGATTEESDYFETNARNLLTSWGDRGNLLTDYANRSWAGLTSSYYKGRWELFFDAVDDALAAGEKLEGERAGSLLETIKDFEYEWWTLRPGSFNSEPQGKVILKKYIGESVLN